MDNREGSCMSVSHRYLKLHDNYNINVFTNAAASPYTMPYVNESYCESFILGHRNGFRCDDVK